MPPSCALMGGFAIGARVALLTCCGNITRARNVSEYMLVLALCLVAYSPLACVNIPSMLVTFISFLFVYRMLPFR